MYKSEIKWLIFLFMAIVIVFTSGCAGIKPRVEKEEFRISRENRSYLASVARDTWDYIDYFVEPNTGLPYDSSYNRGGNTSITNIGFYMSSVAAAHELGFIKKEEALERLNKTLDSMEKIRKWHGFPCVWVDTRILRESKEVYSSADHLGNFVASVILVKNAFPQLQEKCDRILEPMQWADLYDPNTKWLKGGYDIIHEKFPGNNWYYNFLGADTRLSSFFVIASGQVPPEHWGALNHNVEEKYKIQYLIPGWQGGGLFMQFTSGFFFDERATLMGKSASNFAYAQILHAHKIGSPAWGWSSSGSPLGGYLGWGAIKDNVVTPHASALAVIYYPNKVVENLKKLEELGIREEYKVGKNGHNFGFRDALDIKIQRSTNGYLVLDQAMLFLSLTNYLTDGALWNYFESDPFVQKGKSLIKEYQNPPQEEREKLKDIWAQRDAQVDFVNVVPLDLGLKTQEAKRVLRDGVLEASARKTDTPLTIDGDLSDWQDAEAIAFDYKNSLEFGEISDEDDFKPEFWVAWDDTCLYFAAKVKDEESITAKTGNLIWQDDCIELFIDPDLDGFIWKNPKDFQIGLAPSGPAQKPQTWAWFQNTSGQPDILVASKIDNSGGYVIEAAIPWEFLNKQPQKGDAIGLSVAFHDIDNTQTAEAKVNWCYLGEQQKLGRLSLE